MSTLTLPTARIPVGFATVQGQRVPVVIDPEWMRWASTLTERAGGITGVSTTELVESAYEDAGIQEMQALIFANEQGQNQRPPMVDFPAVEPLENTAELSARISALEAQIQALNQGTLL